MLLATAACNFLTSELQKALRDRQFFSIFTWKCASNTQRRAIFQHLNSKKRSETVSFLTFWLGNVLLLQVLQLITPLVCQMFGMVDHLLATAACNFSTCELQKVVRACRVLYILTSKCACRCSGVPLFQSWIFNSLTWKYASRYSGAQFFHIATFFDLTTSKSGPYPYNFKKWAVPLSFLTFWLQIALLATVARNFSTSQLQKVVRACSVLYILNWKCACRYSGVQFFQIWTSKSAPNPSVF